MCSAICSIAHPCFCSYYCICWCSNLAIQISIFFTLSDDRFFFCLQVEMPCSKQQPMTKSQLIHWPANQWLDLATASNWLAKQQSASDILLRLCSMWFANSFKQKRTHTHTKTTLWHLNDVLLMWLKAFHKATLMYLKHSIYWFRDFTFYQCSPSCMPGW